jgi:hypothetical protein
MSNLFAGWEIFQTPSGQLRAGVKCSTVSSVSAGGKAQTPSAEFQPLLATQVALDPSASLLGALRGKTHE